MSRVIFDAPAWWQRPRWRNAAAGVAVTAAVAVWWMVLAPAQPEAITPPLVNTHVVVATRLPTSPVEAIAPALPAAASAVAPSPPAQPALSTMLAPGVHVTPLSVPPGTEPVPAGPRAHDSEAEN